MPIHCPKKITPLIKTLTIKFLIEKGANLQAEDNYAIRQAAKNGHLEVAKLLIEKNVNFWTNDNSAFRLEAENGHLEVVKFLIEKDAIFQTYDIFQ